MPRRSRRRIVGKWEQIEREAREDELKELERELHGEPGRSRRRKPKRKGKHRRQQRRTEPDVPETGTTRDGGSDDKSSDG